MFVRITIVFPVSGSVDSLVQDVALHPCDELNACAAHPVELGSIEIAPVHRGPVPLFQVHVERGMREPQSGKSCKGLSTWKQFVIHLVPRYHKQIGRIHSAWTGCLRGIAIILVFCYIEVRKKYTRNLVYRLSVIQGIEWYYKGSINQYVNILNLYINYCVK